jgi:hypothetical protein
MEAMPMEMPKVLDCTVTGCAYNTKKTCHAIAITIGDAPQNPACDTFFEASPHGGVPDMTAGVGACKVSGCLNNSDYECDAPNIHVGMKGGTPDCLTFMARRS